MVGTITGGTAPFMLIFLMYVLMITFVFMAMRESDFVETW